MGFLPQICDLVTIILETGSGVKVIVTQKWYSISNEISSEGPYVFKKK